MTTAEALEGMTDAGQYEILATRSLRELDDDCRAAAHFGVNEAGKTIANPVDGFCRVPGGDPPRFVMTAFTLNARDGLLRKWLFDHATAPRARAATAADDGDLIKAAREATGLRGGHPGATFIVYLCTNRRLDADLMRPVYDAAATLGVEARFLDQSRLRDFLDACPVGQWLRQEHLGMQADQVSEPLLRHLSGLSLDRYAAELLLTTVDQIVPTATAGRAAAAVRDPSVALHLLVGASGAGKSVMGQDLLRRHVRDGGTGLWVPGEVVEETASLAEAVERVLRLHHPRMGPGAGQSAVRLATAERPLLLVIDDINRPDHPARLLHKVLGWSRPTGDGGKEANAPVRVVCPAWDLYWSPLRHLYESLGWVRVHGVGSMARTEAVSCLRLALAEQAGRFTAHELDGFAGRLGDDPILLGLFGRLLRDDPSTNPNALAEDVLGRLVGKSVGEVALQHSRPEQQYASALKRLSKEMIRRNALYPTWADLGIWLEDDRTSFGSVCHLAAQGHVCRVSERGGASRFEFRHDRILEHQLASAAAEMVSGEGSDLADICDPFFTTILGRAVARHSLPDPALERLRAWQPNSLVAAVPYLPLRPSGYADGVVARARAWLSQDDPIPSRRWDALRTLADSRSPRVLEATEGVPENLWLLQARLRNGDALAGSKAFAISRRFDPATSYAWLESLIDQAKAHHSPRMVALLRQILAAEGQDDDIRRGALCLAGYLGDPCLADAVRAGWQKASQPGDILLAALWAGLRCSGDHAAEVLGPMMPLILDLPDDASQNGFTERNALLQELGHAARHGLGEPVLDYLADLGRKDERYRWIVAALVDEIDHPLAIGYIVPLLAAAKHRADQSGGIAPWAITWGDRWRRRGKDAGSPLSAASLAELRRIWEEADSPDWLKDYAFTLWSSHVRDLTALQAVPEASPHFSQAVWQRASRGDHDVVPHVLRRLAENRRWLSVIAPIWSFQFEPVIDTFLGEVRNKPELREQLWADIHVMLAHLLRDIPPDAAERLLTKHWESLVGIPPFIQVALYVGSPGSKALAEEALASIDPATDPFRYVEVLFGFFTYGRMEKLTEQHLDTLCHRLARVSDHCLADMIQFCRRCGYWDWALRHLDPECRRRIHMTTPGPDERPAYLVQITRHWFPSDEELLGELNQIECEDPQWYEGRIWAWFERSIERGDSPERLPRLLKQWLRESPAITRLKVVASALRGRGTRQDLAILREQRVEDEPGEVEAIVADVAFAIRRRSLE